MSTDHQVSTGGRGDELRTLTENKNQETSFKGEIRGE